MEINKFLLWWLQNSAECKWDLRSLGILRNVEFQNSADLKFLLIYLLFLWDFNLWQKCQNYDALGQEPLYLARQAQSRRPEDNIYLFSVYQKTLLIAVIATII